MMGRPVAVVVGSGPNGLCAAIRLAEAGWPVHLVEASDRIGGAVATQELTLPGFHHDAFSSVYPQGAASPVFARMPLERHGLRWRSPDVCLAHVLAEGEAVLLHRELDATVAALDDHSPGDGRQWRTLVEPLVEHFPALRDAMLAGFPPVRPGLQALRDVPVPALAAFGRLLPQTARAFAEARFSGRGTRAWLYGMGAHSVDPTVRGSALSAVYLGLLGNAVGWPSPVGGAGMLAAALHGYYTALGGSTSTGTPVTRIRARRSRVEGVELADGSSIACDVVVADVLPRALVRLADGGLPARYRRALRRYQLGPATMKLDWALDGPIPWTSPHARRAGTVHAGGDDRELLAALGAAEQDLPERPFLLVGQQTVADPTRAPAGKHTAWAYMHGPRDADWHGRREQMTQRIEQQMERFAPGFSDLVLGRHVAIPADLEARNRNLDGGDVGAGSYELRQLLFRPLVGASPYRTPLEGLYLGSASTFPGGGVHGVCGDAAACAAIEDRRGPARRAAGRMLASAYL